MSKNIMVGEAEDSSVPDKTEIDVKITKITSMMETIRKRLATHQHQLDKIKRIEEQKHTRDTIIRLTQHILNDQ